MTRAHPSANYIVKMLCMLFRTTYSGFPLQQNLLFIGIRQDSQPMAHPYHPLSVLLWCSEKLLKHLEN